MRKGRLVISCIATAFFTAAATGWIVHSASTSSLRPSLPALSVMDADTPPAVGNPSYLAQTAGLQHSLKQDDTTSAALSAILSRFSTQLQAYSTGDLDHEARMLAEQMLREINTTADGRAFVVDAFFSVDDPQQSESLYNLILAADLKDAALIEALAQRDLGESSDAYKTRILDLIADVSTREDAPFSSGIDDYLAQLAQHPEPSLREAGISRRAWYLAQHAKHNSGVLNEFLLAGGLESRREIYELIESQVSRGDVAEIHELTLALESLMNADYLGVPPQEQEKVAALMEKLHAAQ